MGALGLADSDHRTTLFEALLRLRILWALFRGYPWTETKKESRAFWEKNTHPNGVDVDSPKHPLGEFAGHCLMPGFHFGAHKQISDVSSFNPSDQSELVIGLDPRSPSSVLSHPFFGGGFPY